MPLVRNLAEYKNGLGPAGQQLQALQQHRAARGCLGAWCTRDRHLMARTKKSGRKLEAAGHTPMQTNQLRASLADNSNMFEAFGASSDEDADQSAQAQDLSLGNVCAEETQPTEDVIEGAATLGQSETEPSGRKPRKRRKAKALPLDRPILLFDLNGVLVSERESGQYRSSWRIRPGIEQLLQLQHKYYLGVFSSAKHHNVRRALSQLLDAIKSQPLAAAQLSQSSVVDVDGNTAISRLYKRYPPCIPDHPQDGQLFRLLLCRSQCISDPTWRERPDGHEWDTVKPLESNGLPAGRVLLVENEPRKALPEEQNSLLILPTWEHSPDQGQAAWQQLVSSLLALPVEDADLDVRTHTQHINSLLAAASGTGSQAVPPATVQLQTAQPGGVPSAPSAAPSTAAAAGAAVQRPRAADQVMDVQVEKEPSAATVEPPRKLRRTAVRQDIHSAAVVSPDGYLLTAEQLQGEQLAATSDGSLLRAWRVDSPNSPNAQREEGPWKDPERLQADLDDGSNPLNEGDDDSEGGSEMDEDGEDYDADSDLYQELADAMANEECDVHLSDGDGYQEEFPEPEAQPQNGQHKRNRQLAGAAPLYSGPRAVLPHLDPAAEPNTAEPPQQQGPAGRSHGPHNAQLSALHHELAAFAAAAAPSDELIAMLDAAVAAVQTAARAVWPQARAVLFGSQASGLALPGSDLDVVVLGALPRDVDSAAQLHGQAGPAKKALALLLERLSRMRVMKQYEIIRAKVPIIKARMLIDRLMPSKPWHGSRNKAPTLAVDISIGATNGAAAVALMQRCVRALPPLRPLCLAVKALLRDARLNEVFHGGVSSYTVFNLVLAHLQCEGHGAAAAQALRGACKEDLQAVLQATRQHAQHVNATSQRQQQQHPDTVNRQAQDGTSGSQTAGVQAGAEQPAANSLGALDNQLKEYLQFVRTSCTEGGGHHAGGGYDLGDLLASFLYRYSCVVNWGRESVSVRRGGITSTITDANAQMKFILYRLSVEDPQQAYRDLCTGSFSWPVIRLVLQAALQRLVTRTPAQDPCLGIPTIFTQQQGKQRVVRRSPRIKGKVAPRADLGNDTPGPVCNVGALGRFLQQQAVGRRLQPVCKTVLTWRGWITWHQPPPALCRMPNNAVVVVTQPGTVMLPHQAGDSLPGSSSDAAQEEQLWAAVQQEGSHVSQAYAHLLPGNGAQSSSQAGQASVPLAWATQLPLLFDVHAALGFANISHQQQQQPVNGGLQDTAAHMLVAGDALAVQQAVGAAPAVNQQPGQPMQQAGGDPPLSKSQLRRHRKKAAREQLRAAAGGVAKPGQKNKGRGSKSPQKGKQNEDGSPSPGKKSKSRGGWVMG